MTREARTGSRRPTATEVRIADALGVVAEAVRRLQADLPELERRAWPGSAPDGVRSTLGGSGGGGCAHGTPVEDAAFSASHDPVNDDIRRIHRLVMRMSRAAAEAERARAAVLATAAALRGRVASIGLCACCERAVAGTERDRLRSGYCKACYQAWRRWQQGGGEPDRWAFQRHQRATTNGDNALLAAEG